MGYIEMRCPACGTARIFEGSWVRCPNCKTLYPIDELEEETNNEDKNVQTG